MSECPSGEEYNPLLRKCVFKPIMKDWTEIYYWKDIDYMVKAQYDRKYPTIREVKEKYVLLGKLPRYQMDNEDIFMHLQAERWSPRGEARELIRKKGLNHTSMSVGDVICHPNEKRCFIVAPAGFEELLP